jgi:hypothetical protein
MLQKIYGAQGLLGLGSWHAGLGALLALLLLWSIIWKGLALWKAARKESKVWFIVLLFVNTLGILEILYLYVFSEKAPTDSHSA